MSKLTTNGGILDFASVTKALMYLSTLLNEIGVVDLRDCSIESIRPTSLHLVDKNQEVRIDACIGNVVLVVECSNKVSII